MTPDHFNINAKVPNISLKKFLLFCIAVILLFPLFFLFYKTSSIPGNETTEMVLKGSDTDISALEKAASENPSYENLIALSIQLINNKMPGKSIDPLQKAIQLNPEGAMAYNNLGVAYTMMKQYQNGIEACKKALQIEPSFQLAKNNLAWANDEKNKVLKLIQEAEKIPEEKRDVAFYAAQGGNYFMIGDYGKSIEVWSRIFELDKKNTVALNNIGTAFMMKGQVEDAIVLFKKVLELEPGNQLAKNNLAWAMEEKQKKSN
jgi:protein O-mannosyl-transferase